MIKNEHIESINKSENGHILLVIKGPSRKLLSLPAFANALYDETGCLEFNDDKQVELFLEANTPFFSKLFVKA